MFYLYKGILHRASGMTDKCNVDYNKAEQLTEYESLTRHIDSILKPLIGGALEFCPHCNMNNKDTEKN